MPRAAATSDTSSPIERSTFQQASDQARAELSASSTASTTEKAPKPESTSAAAGATSSSSTPPAPASTSKPGAAAATPSDLISDEEYQALATTHAEDPAALRKALLGVFTTKTTELAEQRRAIEPYADLIADFEADAETTLTNLAAQYGLKVTKGDGAPAAAAASSTATAVDEAVQEFRTALGEEYGFLADALAPAVRKMAERVAQGVVAEQVGPLRASQDTLVSRAAQEQTATVMKSFGEKHPDWQQHEPAIMALATKLQPNGMDELEYLETLYTLATKDQKAAQTVRGVVERMVTDAQRADGEERATAETRVATASPKRPTFAEAAEAAKRGVRFED